MSSKKLTLEASQMEGEDKYGDFLPSGSEADGDGEEAGVTRVWDDEKNRKDKAKSQRKRARDEEKELKRANTKSKKPAPKAKKSAAASQSQQNQPTLAQHMQGGTKKPAVKSEEDIDARVKALLAEADDDDDDEQKPSDLPPPSSLLADVGNDSDSSDSGVDIHAYKRMLDLPENDDVAPSVAVKEETKPSMPAPPPASLSEQFNAGTSAHSAPATDPVTANQPAKHTATVGKTSAKPNYAIKEVDLTTDAYEVKLEVGAGGDVKANIPEHVLQQQKFGNCPTIYWLDAKERSYTDLTDPGSITLIGKHWNGATGRYESCAARVQHLERVVNVLGVPGVPELEVVRALSIMCSKAGIEKRTVKVVQKWYAFEDPDVPQGCSTWFELRYPASDPPLDVNNYRGNHQFKCIKKMLGADRSLIELFLLKSKMKGPCFLAMSNATKITNEREKVTHCVHEFILKSDDDISVALDSGSPLVAPPLTAMSIHIAAQLDPTEKHNEIHGAGLVVVEGVNVDGRTMHGSGVPFTRRMVGLRHYDKDTPIPLELSGYCSKRQLISDRSDVKVFVNEENLLEWILKMIERYDPDIIVGHNFMSWTLDIMLHRLSGRRGLNWSLLGRIKQHAMPQLQAGVGGTKEATYQEKQLCCGRLIVDSLQSAREHYKTTSYKVMELAQSLNVEGLFGAVSEAQLAMELKSFSKELYLPRTTATATPVLEDIFHILIHILNVSLMSMGIVLRLDVIPLTKRLTTLAGNLWSRTLNGARAERIEYLLLHHFHERGFVTPERVKMGGGNRKTQREEEIIHAAADDNEAAAADDALGGKAKYKGGKVLEPQKGLYTDYVLLLDFNSLYPSIIQEYNICFTTVDRAGKKSVAEGIHLPTDDDLVCSYCRNKQESPEAGATASTEFYSASNPCPHRIILPRVIKELVVSRREVKKLMAAEKDPAKYSQYDIRQKALKLTANSMYGCLGFEYSRFYAQPLAELVTMQGREALTKAAELVPAVVPELPLKVIYGDTDSVMIQTGIKDSIAQARQVAELIKSAVNRHYKTLEIDIDGIFRTILLVRKKKYAALNVVDFKGKGEELKAEVKGLDMVRRDWCPLSQRVSKTVLDRLLDPNQDPDDLLRFINQTIAEVASACRGGSVGLAEYCIKKSITKAPDLYRTAGGSIPAHAAVALRMKENNQSVRSGDLIPYVICLLAEDSTQQGKTALSDRALHVDECAQQQRPVDVEWYLETQVLPPVLRLCEHIPGFSESQLADSAGLASRAAATSAAARAQPNAGTAAGAPGAAYATSSYGSLFNYDEDLANVFPQAEKLEAYCNHCRAMSPIEPHSMCRKILKGEIGLHKNKPCDAAGKHPVVPTTRNDANLRLWLYRCDACQEHFPLGKVTNNLTFAIRKAQRNFYKAGGTVEAFKKLQNQLSYFRALFDIPQMPGIPYELKYIHIHVLRCLTEDSKRCSIADGEMAFNLPLHTVTMAYNQLDSHFVTLENVL